MLPKTKSLIFMSLIACLAVAGCDCNSSDTGNNATGDGGGNATGDGGNATGDGGNATGDGGNATGDGGNATGDGGNATGDGGNATGDGGGQTCDPLTAAQVCPGHCGFMSDGCGSGYDCSSTANQALGGIVCSGGATCTGANNTCATTVVDLGVCTPTTCAALGHQCGLAMDGCGGSLNCWPTAAQECPNANQVCIPQGPMNVQTCVSGSQGCSGALCDSVPTCSGMPPTRLTGTVVTPGRSAGGGTFINRVPVPNAVVYIPADTTSALPDIFEGVDGSNPLSCGRCADEKFVADGLSVLAGAVTDYRGQFTLEGRIPVGVPFNIVIKVGKWRRVVQIPAGTTTACATATLTQELTRLNATPTDGLAGTHLPKIAISTGDVDEMECVLRSIGIAESQFTVPSGSGRIHMYRGNGASISNIPNETNLYRNATTLNGYDIAIFDCQGEADADYPNYISNMRNYVNSGGRLFASHWAYNWITSDTTATSGMVNSAAWNGSGSTSDDEGYISLPTGSTQRAGANAVKAPAFRDWLDYMGALDWSGGNDPAGLPLNYPNPPQFEIIDPRDLAGATVGSFTDEWVYRTTSGNPRVQQLSFNTPYAAASSAVCGRVAYSGFHVANAPSNNDENFPNVCSNAALTPQELVLVYMLFDLNSCVSTGDPVQPPQCTPLSASNVCPNVNDACGYVSDGCGGLIDCAGCAAGYYCSVNSCVQVPVCTPQTCTSLGNYECGQFSDGCGGIADGTSPDTCGTCPVGEFCGPDGMCSAVSCTPNPSACTQQGFNCGTTDDGCGNILNCGTCASTDECLANVCYYIGG